MVPDVAGVVAQKPKGEVGDQRNVETSNGEVRLNQRGYCVKKPRNKIREINALLWDSWFDCGRHGQLAASDCECLASEYEMRKS